MAKRGKKKASAKKAVSKKQKQKPKDAGVDDLRSVLPAVIERVCQEGYRDDSEFDEDLAAVQECRQMLVLFAQPVANTVMAYDMIKFLLEKVVIDSDKARLIRRMGKGQNAETNRQILAELGTRGVREYEVFVEGVRKQDFSLLADLLEQKHFSRMINILDPVAKKLGHHWKRVALELGTAGFVVKIETKYEKVREQALYSLLIWEETSGVAATEKRLMDALDYCGMKWAIAFVRKLQGKGGKKKKGKKKGKKKK